MNLEDRLRDAFAQRADAVEVSPGALFEIQRRIRPAKRVPQLRLRPALVLAAAACAAIATVVSVSLTNTATDPGGEIVIPPVASPSTEPGSAPPPPPSTPTAPGPTPPAVSGTDPPQEDTTGIATVTPTPPAPDPLQSDPPPPPDPPPSSGTGTETGSVISTAQPETSQCAAQPAGAEGAETPAAWVTVYFACGESDAAPRRRPAAANDLATALGVLLGGPNEAEVAAGFRGLSSDAARTASPAPEKQWVTIDLPSNLADSFSADTAAITAEQFLAQLNATVFEFSEVGVAEYRLNGDCAAFGNLLDRSCEIHTRDGGSHTSELTAHTIGATQPSIRSEPSDGAAALGLLADGARLTDRRAGSAAWAEVITTAGVQGWVPTDMLVAQPLALDDTATATMESLARRLTTGPEVDSPALLPGGLVLRWGAGSDDVTRVSTAGAGTDSTWWDRALDVPNPRDDSATSSLADLLWIDGESDSAIVRVNTPGPLGEPHTDFSSLAYVSVYQGVVAGSALPPVLQAAPDPPTTTTTTEAGTNSDEVELPPDLPSPDDEEEEEDTTTEEESPVPRRAQLSVIFDFLSPDGPRIAAVEAIWIQP